MMEFPKDFSQHKKTKKRLIAPFNAAMGNIVKTSTWHLERMPEVIWISEMIATLGPKTSLDILCHIVGCGLELPNLPESRIAPFMASFWKKHSEHTPSVAKQLSKKEAQQVSNALCQFASLYPDYPTNWLVSTAEMSHSDQYLNQFKSRLSQLLNRFSRLSMMTQAHSFLCLCRLGRMKFPRDMEIPDVNVVYNEHIPQDSEEYQKAAGFIRTSASSYFTFAEGLSTAAYFWNRGLELEACDTYMEVGDDDE